MTESDQVSGSTDCPLCDTDGGQVLARTAQWRIVLADEPAFPGFTRVIWEVHAAEMTDLSPAARTELMRVVFAVEQLMREHLCPDKINLASLGNQVAHLHWHVIARYRTDSHFPAPVWAPAERQATGLPEPGQILTYSAAIKAWAKAR